MNEFHRDELESSFFKAGEDLANETTLDAIRLVDVKLYARQKRS